MSDGGVWHGVIDDGSKFYPIRAHVEILMDGKRHSKVLMISGDEKEDIETIMDALSRPSRDGRNRIETLNW